MPYEVRWIDSRELTDSQLAVWERNHGSEPARRRFDWLYRDNPGGAGRVAVLETLGADGVPHPVGIAGVATRALRVNGAPRTAGVLADIAVDKAHRTLLPALQLLREVRREALERHGLAYGFPNERVVNLVTRAGCRTLGQTRRFAQVLRHARYLRESVPPAVATLGGAALDVARTALVAARGARAALVHRLEWVTTADERFDRLWVESAGAYPTIGVRDAAFVRWRFLERPARPLQVAALIRRADGGIDGYAAVRRDGPAAQIGDLFALPAKLPALLGSLAASLVWQGAESLSMRVCGSPQAADALRALGFRERADRRTVIVDGPQVEVPGTPEDWYVTDADEDA